MRNYLNLIVLGVLMLATATPALAIQRVVGVNELRLELGTGLLLQMEKDYRDDFGHGLNGRLAFYHQSHGRLIFGLQYRVFNKDNEAPGGSTEMTAHFFGLKIGGLALKQERSEVSIAALVYLTHERQSTRILCYECGTPQIVDSRTGPALGFSASYIYLAGRLITLGGEIEYNHTFLDDYPGEPGNIGGVWISLLLGFRL